MIHQNIFGDRNYKQKLAGFSMESIPDLANKTRLIENFIRSIESGKIEKAKEEAIQADFLNTFFGDVLGYDYNDPNTWNLEKEFKSFIDGTKADGVLGFFSMEGKTRNADVRAIIELKDALTDLDKPQNRLGDKRTPVEQAFSYSSKAGGRCKWVIVSNFKGIRIYHASDQSRYEKITVQELLNPEHLERFFFLLYKDRFISKKGESMVDILYRERMEYEQTISKLFYTRYKAMRGELFEHLEQHNPHTDPLLLIAKTQKLLDRFIFVCFCEDVGLLPFQTLKKTKDILKNAVDFEPDKLWRQLKGLFHSIDIGNPPLEINKFNGGLFKKDNELDALTIKDDILLKLIGFSDFDFASDLNVNILGHIFEQSLSDIEEMKAQIGNGKPLTADEKVEIRKNGKRKKEGIFYTPEYITRYIVKEAIGGWLEDRKNELGFYLLPELVEDDFNSIRTVRRKSKDTGKMEESIEYNSNIRQHIDFWEAYKEQVQKIKILDPACGSGAFLNQAFDYLYSEGRKVYNELSRLRLGHREIFELDRHILTRNIYGVDINPESVEITKLSLWLKTASKGKELTALDENIKCGNSLVDDVSVAGEKAFHWEKEYREIMEQDGFDVIIGNPPYIPTEEIPGNQKIYFSKAYKSAFGRINIYPIFYEKAIRLVNQEGIIAFITPYTILKNKYYIEARRIILDNTWIKKIVDFQDAKIFEDATVDSIILILQKTGDKEKTVSLLDNIVSFESHDYRTREYSQKKITTTEDLSFILTNSELTEKAYRNSKRVSEVINFNQGIITGDNKRFISHINGINSKPVITGSDFNRYSLSYPGLFIEYTSNLHRPRAKDIFEVKEKILLRQTGSYPICTIDTNQYYTLDTVHNGIVVDTSFNIKYLVCLLNSKLLRYIYNAQIKETGKVFAQVKIMYIDELPVKIIPEEKQKTFIEKADIILSQNIEFHAIRLNFIRLIRSKWSDFKISGRISQWYKLANEDFSREFEKQKIKLSLRDQAEWLEYFNEQKQKAELIYSTIEKTDTEIDNMVYRLYDLTEDEIALIEKEGR